MYKLIEPPSFISETKSFKTYKKDLARWARWVRWAMWAMLTTLEETKQVLLVVNLLDGDPSGINEKIDEGVSEDDLKSKDGITILFSRPSGHPSGKANPGSPSSCWRYIPNFWTFWKGYTRRVLSLTGLRSISRSRCLEEVKAKVSRNLFQNGPQLTRRPRTLVVCYRRRSLLSNSWMRQIFHKLKEILFLLVLTTIMKFV